MNEKDAKNLIIGLIISCLISIVLHMFVNEYIGLFFMFGLNLYLIIRFLKNREDKVNKVVRYLEDLNQGDYNYDISAYSEGELSKLLSELNKTTIHMQRLNTNLSNQKEFLLESLENISHQLKTPIASLLLLNELQDEDELVVKSYDQIERLNYLTESLLKLVRLDAKIEDFEIEKTNLKELVQKAIKVIDPLLMDLRLELNLIDSDAYFDFNKTLEAVINVLNNKTRFAKSLIKLNIVETKLHTILEISDDGPEIETEIKEKIFERFYSGKNRTSKSIGIGLPIAKEIMINQEGSLYIKDRNSFVFKFSKFI